jgi:adenylate cyclase
MSIKKVHSEVITIMFIDIVSYTKTTTKLKRVEFDNLHEIFDRLTKTVFKEYSGNVIKKIGDAFLITFKSATNAVLCGMALQSTLKYFNEKHKLKQKLEIRVAIHTGEVLIRDGDVYGDTVNITSRIEGVAKAGEVVFSEIVHSTINKNEIKTAYIGSHKLKGLERPINLFRVQTKKDLVLLKKKERKKRTHKVKRFFKRTLLKIVLLAIIGILIFFLIRLVIIKN